MLAAAANSTTLDDHFEVGLSAMLDGFERMGESPGTTVGSPQHR